MLRSRCFAEFFGTFALVFVGCGAITVNWATGADAGGPGALGHLGVSLVFGLTVMAVIYTFGEISGAHINPAVTLAFWWAGRFAGRDVWPYISSQIAGAVLASFSLWFIFHGIVDSDLSTWGVTAPHPKAGIGPAFALECIFTFLLMMVIIHVSTGSKETGVMAGIAIGGTIAVGSLVVGPVTGGSFNPARSLGPALALQEFTNLWIYLAAPVVGAIAATMVCRITRPGADCC